MKVLMRNQKISAQKLRTVARTISGDSVSKALQKLAFAPQKAAKIVEKALKSAIANAEFNNNADADFLMVCMICVDQSYNLKRHTQKAKGRGAQILKPYSHLRIELQATGAQ